MKKYAVFLDRDGTLMENVDYCCNPQDVHVFPGVTEGLQRLREAGWLLIVATNQSGIGRGWIQPEEYAAVDQEFRHQVQTPLDAVYFCPELPDSPADCRKPKDGMLRQAAKEWDIDLARSWMVGDSLVDMQCGRAAGCRTILVQTGNGGMHAEELADQVLPRFAEAANHILKTNDTP